MTRETKIGMTVAGSFLSLVGIVVGTKMYKGDVSSALEGLAASLPEATKEADPSGIKPPDVPGILPAGFANTSTIPGDSSGFSSAPQPPPSLEGFNLPSLPDPSAFAKDTANDINRMLELQKKQEAERLRNITENAQKDFANAGNRIIDGVNKTTKEIANDLQRKTNNAFENLPPVSALADPGGLSFPPVPPINVASDTIVGGGKQTDSPALPVAPPPVPVPAPKTIIGGNPPPTSPNFSPVSPKDVPPSFAPIISDPKPAFRPVSPIPAVGDLPPLPKDPFAQPSTNQPEPNNSRNPLLAPGQPLISTPTTTIVAPAPKNDPFPPVPPIGNSFGPSPSPNANPTPPPPAFGQPPTASNPPFGTPPPPPDPFATPQPPPQNPNVAPWNPQPVPVPTTPLVKIDNSKRYTCQGNENFALISAREYGGNENFALALEEYNRDLPGAPDALRAQPARLQPGTVVMIPTQNYLLSNERYARFVTAGSNLPPVRAATAPRPFGNEIGIGQPAPGNNVSRPAVAADTGTTSYRVPTGGMYLSQVAERQLGSALRWIDIYRLNPGLQPEQPLREGLEIRVPVK